MFILNPSSGVPIYRQILEQVRRMVASGQLPPGTALPSVRELASRHTINPMTISRAMHQAGLRPDRQLACGMRRSAILLRTGDFCGMQF